MLIARLACSAFALFSISGLAAKADTFQFTASSSGYAESGTLTATNNGDGSYTVTAVTGPDITGLIAPGQFQSNDNLLFPANSRLIDVDGLGFTAAFAGVDYSVDLFSTINAYEALVFGSDGSFYDLPVDVSLTGPASVTPEPSSVLLLGTGLLCTAAAAFRRRAF